MGMRRPLSLAAILARGVLAIAPGSDLERLR
jgi:hypothetical protein